MKKFLSFKDVISTQVGFTLIELLVVIGILGILAASLVATIDPFEQLKKANDSNARNAMVEFLNANVRYYTTHNKFPWDDTTYVACYNSATPPSSAALNGAQVTNCIKALTDENELKQAFSSATVLKNIYVTYSTGTNELIGCYKPESKSQQKESNTKFNRDGVENTVKDCTSTAPTNGCYWCTR